MLSQVFYTDRFVIPFLRAHCWSILNSKDHKFVMIGLFISEEWEQGIQIHQNHFYSCCRLINLDFLPDDSIAIESNNPSFRPLSLFVSNNRFLIHSGKELLRILIRLAVKVTSRSLRCNSIISVIL